MLASWMNRGVFSAMSGRPSSYWYRVQHIREHLVVLVHFLPRVVVCHVEIVWAILDLVGRVVLRAYEDLETALRRRAHEGVTAGARGTARVRGIAPLDPVDLQRQLPACRAAAVRERIFDDPRFRVARGLAFRSAVAEVAVVLARYVT